MRTFVCVSFFSFFVFWCLCVAQKTSTSLYSSVVYTPRHAKTSSHSHPQKQSLGLRHNKGLACIPPARSWLLLRAIWQAGLVKVASLFGRQFSSWTSYRRWARWAHSSWRAESTDRITVFMCILLGPTTYRKDHLTECPEKAGWKPFAGLTPLSFFQ